MLKIKLITLAVASLVLLSLACRQEHVTAAAKAQLPTEYQNLGLTLSGTENSPVKIAIFSDFQCFACRTLFINAIKPLIDEYKDKVSVTYYEYPLNIHQYARLAARYIAASAKLGPGKALPVMEAIFADQDNWAQNGNLEPSLSRALSREDFLKVQKMLRNEEFLAEIDALVDREHQLGMSKNVRSTPTMFIYYGDNKEQKVEGSATYPVLRQFIDPLVK